MCSAAKLDLSMNTSERNVWMAEALDAVLHLTEMINAGQDTDRVFDGLTKELARFIAYDRCSYAVVDRSANLFRVVNVRSTLPAYASDNIPQLLEGSTCGWVVEHRKPLLFTVGEVDRFPEDGERRASGIVSVAVLPVTVDNMIVGTLAVSSKHQAAYHSAQLWLMETITKQFGLVVAATTLRTNAERRARHAQFLADVGGILAEATDVSQVFDQVLTGASVMFGDVNAILLRGSGDDSWIVRALAARTPAAAEVARTVLSSLMVTGSQGLLDPVFEGSSLLLHRQPTITTSHHDLLAAAWPAARSFLASPMVVHGKVLGAFVSANTVATSDDEDTTLFSELDLQASREFARRLADALARSQLHAETERALDTSEALRRIGQELLTSVDQNQVVDLVTTFARNLLDADYAGLAVQEPNGMFTWQTVFGNVTKGHLIARFPCGIGPAGRVVAMGQPLVVDDFAEATEFLPDELQPYLAEGLKSAAIVPLRAEGRVFGTLLVGCRQTHHFSPNEIHLTELLAAQAALALEHARLFGETRQALAERDRFLSVAAHELRTPLTTLRGRLQLLQRRLQGSATPQTEDTMRIILRQVDRLTHMVSDLLDLSRLRTGRLPLDRARIDLVALTRQCVDEANEHDSGAPVRFTTMEKAIVGFVDPWRYEQVMSNLITNARRFTAEQGKIEVSLRREGNLAIIEVVDDGIGIPIEDLERIFEPFYQVNPSGGKGVGLGLPICREIITDHGGRMWAAPANDGQGAVFTVVLPLDDPE